MHFRAEKRTVVCKQMVCCGHAYLFSVGEGVQKDVTSVRFSRVTLLIFHEGNDADETNENKLPLSVDLQPGKISSRTIKLPTI